MRPFADIHTFIQLQSDTLWVTSMRKQLQLITIQFLIMIRCWQAINWEMLYPFLEDKTLMKKTLWGNERVNLSVHLSLFSELFVMMYNQTSDSYLKLTIPL